VLSVKVNNIEADVVVNKDEESVDWQVELDVPDVGEMQITVETTDRLGFVEEQAATATLLTNGTAVPRVLVLDNAQQQLIYPYINLINGAPHGELKVNTFDLSTDENISSFAMSDSAPSFQHSVYVDSLKKVVGVDLDSESLTIKSLDPNNGSVKSLFSHELTVEFMDWKIVQVTGVDIDQQDNELYILLRYASEDWEIEQNTIFKYEIVPNKLTKFFDGSYAVADPNSPFFEAENDFRFLNVTSEEIVLTDIFGDTFFMDKSSANITSFISPNLSKQFRINYVVSNSENHTLYFVAQLRLQGYDWLKTYIIASDVKTKKTTILIGDDSTNQLITRIIPSSNTIVFNKLTMQLIFKDIYGDFLAAYNVLTGEQSILIDKGIGSGPKISGITQMAIDEKNNIAYLATHHIPDIRTSEIVAIDLLTGNRKKVIDTVELQDEGIIRELFFDEKTGLLSLIFSQAVFSLNPATGETFIVTDNNIDASWPLEHLGVVAIDKNHANSATLVTFDLLTGFISEFSLPSIDNLNYFKLRSLVVDSYYDFAINDFSSVSKLPYPPRDFSGYNPITHSAAFDVEHTTLFIADNNTGKIFSWNYLHKNKELLLDSCLNSNGEDMLSPGYYDDANLHFDATNNVLYIAARSLVLFDLNTKNCKATSIYVDDIVVTKDNNIFGVQGNALYQLDIDNNQMVVVSK
jgi:hypothetical protein